MSELNIEYVKTKNLIPYVNNSRTHSDQQIQQVAASIKEFGFTNPILTDEENGIIAGHGRLMAAQVLGLDEVPTITLKGLSESQKKAYVIADNQLALNSGWDLDKLKLELNQLENLNFNLDLIGFEGNELSNLLGFGADFSPASEEDQGQLDELDPKYICCPNCGKEFDMRTVQ